MTFKFSALLCGLLISSAAMAQDYGLTVGIHNTSASATTGGTGTNSLPTGSVSSRLGYDVGLTASFELLPNWRFRSGVLYDTRPFDFKVTGGQTVGFNFSYIDIPVNVQYNFTPMVGIYGGLIVGVKAGDSMNNAGSYSPEAKSLIPLVNVGVNFMFNDMIGFDVYGENGVGDFANNVKNYQTIGLHFIYWM